MKSKEEMIEVICDQDAVINACRAYASRCGTVDEIVDEVMTALCGALPDVKSLRERYDSMGLLSKYRGAPEVQQDINSIYFQLKQWGEK